jgi:hypothetical protein
MGGVPVGMAVLQPPVARWAYASATSEPGKVLLEHGDQGKVHSTVTLAHAATTSGRNDVVFLTPETHDQTATITWSNSNTHLIGMHNGSRWANSCIIENTSASTVVPVFTLSGANCLIENIHFKNAVGSNAANLTAVRVSGSGNLFQNCWFEGPCDNSVADLDTFRTVQIGGGGNTFRNCVFGSTSVFLSGAGALVEYYTTTYRATFEDCIFYTVIDATTPYVFYVKTGKAQGTQFYRNCQFAIMSTNQAYDMATLFGFQADDATGNHVFDSNCHCYNVTDIAVGVNPLRNIYWGTQEASTGGATIGRSIVTS